MPWQFPRAHLEVGTDLPFAFAYAVADVLLLSPCSWASPGASGLQDLHLAMLLCSQRICDTIRNRRYRIFCATLCLFLKPSNRKFPCLESFNFETPLRKWNIFWLRNRTPCLPEEQNRRYRDATLYLSNMRFWSKSQGVGPSKIENILWRKCTSDITAGRAVLYRVMKENLQFNTQSSKICAWFLLQNLFFCVIINANTAKA